MNECVHALCRNENTGVNKLPTGSSNTNITVPIDQLNSPHIYTNLYSFLIIIAATLKAYLTVFYSAAVHTTKITAMQASKHSTYVHMQLPEIGFPSVARVLCLVRVWAPPQALSHK